jgi:hypothetical protein
MLGERELSRMLSKRNNTILNSTIPYSVPHLKSAESFKKVYISPEFKPHTDDHISRRAIMNRYKLPSIKIPKRLTPSPSKSNINIKPSTTGGVLARCAEPVSLTGNLLNNILNDVVSPLTSIKTLHSLSEHIGSFFPLECFIDHEIMDKFCLLNNTDSIIFARSWPKYPGKYYSTFECLLESSSDESIWHPCQIIEVDRTNYLFVVRWINPRDDLGILNSKTSPKLLSELVVSKKELPAFKQHLSIAQRHRAEFEYFFALEKSVSEVRLLSVTNASYIYDVFTKKKLQESNDKSSIKYHPSLFKTLSKEITQNVIENSQLKAFLVINPNFLNFLPSPNHIAVASQIERTSIPKGIIEQRSHIVKESLNLFMCPIIVEFRSKLIYEMDSIFSVSNHQLFSIVLSRIHPQVPKSTQSSQPDLADLCDESETRIQTAESDTSPKIDKQDEYTHLLGAVPHSRNVPIVPTLDENIRQISYDVEDFIDAVDWVYDEFIYLYSSKLPTIVHLMFQHMLKSYGLESRPTSINKLTATTPPQSANIISENSIYERLANYVTIFWYYLSL